MIDAFFWWEVGIIVGIVTIIIYLIIQTKKMSKPTSGVIATENRCVCCGDIIPEGRQICPICETKIIHAEGVVLNDCMVVADSGNHVRRDFGNFPDGDMCRKQHIKQKRKVVGR